MSCKATISEIDKRIKIAAKFKCEKGGSEIITPEVLGDSVDYSGRQTSRKRSWAKPHDDFAKLVRTSETRKKNRGGIIGVSVSYTYSPPQYSVHLPGSKTTKKCAIDAAESRNAAFEAKYPGVAAFQCDMDAVWRKWGCTCGEHERGDGE